MPKPTIDTLSPAMRRNLVRALSCDPRPYPRVHFSQATALERRGLVTVEFAVIGHRIDLMLGSTNIRLTDVGRGIARAIKREEEG